MREIMPYSLPKDMIEEILNKILSKSKPQELRQYLLNPDLLLQKVKDKLQARIDEEHQEIESRINQQASLEQAEEDKNQNESDVQEKILDDGQRSILNLQSAFLIERLVNNRFSSNQEKNQIQGQIETLRQQFVVLDQKEQQRQERNKLHKDRSAPRFDGKEIEQFSEHLTAVLEAERASQKEIFKEQERLVELELHTIYPLYVAKLKSSLEGELLSSDSPDEIAALKTTLSLMEEQEHLNQLFMELTLELESQKTKLQNAEDYIKPLNEKRDATADKKLHLMEQNKTLEESNAALRRSNDELENLMEDSFFEILGSVLWLMLAIVGSISTVSVLLSNPVGVLLVFAWVCLAVNGIGTGWYLIDTLNNLDDILDYYFAKNEQEEHIEENENLIQENRESLIKLEIAISPVESLSHTRVQALVDIYKADISSLSEQLTGLEELLDVNKVQLMSMQSGLFLDEQVDDELEVQSELAERQPLHLYYSTGAPAAFFSNSVNDNRSEVRLDAEYSNSLIST